MVPTRGQRASESARGSQQLQQPPGNEQPSKQSRKSRPIWLDIADDLSKLSGELATTSLPDLQRRIDASVQRLRAIDTPVHADQDIIELLNNGFRGLEKRITTLSENARTPKAATWAGVAAAAAAVQAPVAVPQSRPAVRVRIPEAANKSAAELLAKVKPIIPGAYAVRQLRSGDIEVAVPDQKTKDQTLNQQETDGCKILRQDYPVEVPGVPLSLDIQNRKSPENEAIIRSICQANKRMMPQIAINRIRWLHNDKAQEERRKNGKTRGTVIISFPTQALQHEAIRKGVVIEAQIYDARLYSQGLEVKQCFTCNQWGHTQSACGKQARCGECAGPHQSRDCPKQRVSCCNCGRPHRAWQKRACRLFQTYLEDIQARRVKLVAETAAIRAAAGPQAALSTSDFTFVASGKRNRDRSPAGNGQNSQPPPKRGSGRPPNVEVLARDRSQGNIRSMFLSTAAPQATPSVALQASSQASSQISQVSSQVSPQVLIPASQPTDPIPVPVNTNPQGPPDSQENMDES